jgi:hypothetical protein
MMGSICRFRHLINCILAYYIWTNLTIIDRSSNHLIKIYDSSKLIYAIFNDEPLEILFIMI